MLLACGLLLSTTVHAQYLKCFRDEGGVLHEVRDKMPDQAPPPTIHVNPPTTTTTTLPGLSFNHELKTYWHLMCPNNIVYQWFTRVEDCTQQREWLAVMCPRPRVDTRDGFRSLDHIRKFRLSCGTDNGLSCHCTPEYW
jgi:hypothetical protein